MKETLQELARQVIREVSEELEVQEGVFSFRGDGVSQKEAGSPAWVFRFWYESLTTNDTFGIEFEVELDDLMGHGLIKGRVTEAFKLDMQRFDDLKERLEKNKSTS